MVKEINPKSPALYIRPSHTKPYHSPCQEEVAALFTSLKKKRKTKTKHKQIVFLFPKQFVQNKSNTVSNFKIIIIIKKIDQKENRKWVLLLIDIQCTATSLSVNSELSTKKEG